jgi:hypothetical protein
MCVYVCVCVCARAGARARAGRLRRVAGARQAELIREREDLRGVRARLAVEQDGEG